MSMSNQYKTLLMKLLTFFSYKVFKASCITLIEELHSDQPHFTCSVVTWNQYIIAQVQIFMNKELQVFKSNLISPVYQIVSFEHLLFSNIMLNSCSILNNRPQVTTTQAINSDSTQNLVQLRVLEVIIPHFILK